MRENGYANHVDPPFTYHRLRAFAVSNFPQAAVA
jgi:hypothetical protein